MTAETIQNNTVTKTFKYSFPTCTNEDIFYKLEVPLEIPHSGSTRELVQRVIKMFHIPVYLEDDLNEKLAIFVSEETKQFHNDRDTKLLDQLKKSELNVEGIVKNWEKLFKENVVEFAEQKGTSDEEVFATAYHKLVHSPALETILQVESSYAKTVTSMLKSRDEDIQSLTVQQTEEMEEKVRLLNTFTTEEEINALAADHFEQQSLAAGRWDSQLDALRHTQRAAHRTWLMAALNEYQTDEKVTPSNSPLCTFPPEMALPLQPAPPRQEESFTIHLGSQLKQTHNIRLVAVDMMDLCFVSHSDSGSWSRVQPALALYSSELSGAVMLTDFNPERSPLVRAARTTEHHFADLDTQLREIVQRVKEPAEKRNGQRQAQAEGASASGGGGGRAGGGGGGRGRVLQAGDVFVTRHSNLAEAHVVFHLVVDDDSLKSGDITSRHPAILGLRNILKTACCNDVTSVTIPLLLRHELTEEMTAAWCLRRAELVLKCVKGFVLEASASGGAELRTLTFAVPPAASSSLFTALATLLPAVFRVAGPVRAVSASKR